MQNPGEMQENILNLSGQWDSLHSGPADGLISANFSGIIAERYVAGSTWGMFWLSDL